MAIVDTDGRTSSADYTGIAEIGDTSYGILPACRLKTLKNDVGLDNVITVSKPVRLRVTATNTTALNLKWNKVEDATGYVVYRYNSSSKKYSKLGSTKKCVFKVENLQTRTTYQFAVRAYKRVDGKNYYSNYSSLVQAITK